MFGITFNISGLSKGDLAFIQRTLRIHTETSVKDSLTDTEFYVEYRFDSESEAMLSADGIHQTLMNNGWIEDVDGENIPIGAFHMDIWAEEFDLPGNMPPGIASKLNMKKTSLEIGGMEFPDETYGESQSDQSLMYKEAESFVINYIWSGLQEQGITGIDGANIIQEDVDIIRFSGASTLVRQLLDEGFTAYINQTNNPVLRESAELRQSLYNAIKTAILEEGEI